VAALARVGLLSHRNKAEQAFFYLNLFNILTILYNYFIVYNHAFQSVLVHKTIKTTEVTEELLHLHNKSNVKLNTSICLLLFTLRVKIKSHTFKCILTFLCILTTLQKIEN
jgi:hypothetical protein